MNFNILKFNIRQMQQGLTTSIGIRNLPWTDIGIDNSTQRTISDVLVNSKLDYQNELIKVYDKDGNEMKGFLAITRSDKKGIAHGYVKNRYVVPQNHTEFEFFDKFIQQTDSQYGYAGQLWNGEIVWFFARTNDVIKIAGTTIRIYVMLTIHHTGRHGKQITFIPIKEDCNNVLISNIHGAENTMGIPNKKSLIEDAENIDMMINAKQLYVKCLSAKFKELQEKTVNEKTEKMFFNRVVTGSLDVTIGNLSGTFANKIANMSDFYRNHPTQQSIIGTTFGLYNAVGGYYMNIKEYTSPEKRFNNLFIGGDAYRSIEDAFRLARQIS